MMINWNEFWVAFLNCRNCTLTLLGGPLVLIGLTICWINNRNCECCIWNFVSWETWKYFNGISNERKLHGMWNTLQMTFYSNARALNEWELIIYFDRFLKSIYDNNHHGKWIKISTFTRHLFWIERKKNRLSIDRSFWSGFLSLRFEKRIWGVFQIATAPNFIKFRQFDDQQRMCDMLLTFWRNLSSNHSKCGGSNHSKH